jgi:hypothetical protein
LTNVNHKPLPINPPIDIWLGYLELKRAEAETSSTFEIFRIPMQDALNNGYYPQIAIYYLQSLRIFLLKNLIPYEDGKLICEEILMDYSGDFEHNYELFESYRGFIGANGAIGAEQKDRQVRNLWQRQLKVRS